MSEQIQSINTGLPIRTVEAVTLEIKTLHRQAQQIMLGYAIEIGRRLIEVKELLPHGEWGGYLETQVEYSQSTANNFMRLFEEYGSAQNSLFGAESNSQALGNLPYTKALMLLAVPSEQREEFVESNDIEDMSTRELGKVIKDLAAEKERADELENKVTDVSAALEETKAERDAAGKELARLELELKELSSRPVDVAVETVSDEAALAAARAEAKKEAEKELSDKIQKATEARKKADEKLKAAQERQAASEAALEKTTADMSARVEALEKQLKVSGNQDLTIFKLYFEGAQENFNKMMGCLVKLQSAGDLENASKLKAAAVALVDKWHGEIDGVQV